MASIERDGDSWCVRWRTLSGKARRRRGFKTRREADDFCHQVEVSRRRGEDWQPRLERIRPQYVEVCQKYLSWAASRLARRTLEDRALIFERYAAWRWPGAQAPDWSVTIEDLERFSDGIVANGGGRLYANLSARAVRTLWAWAATREEWKGLIDAPMRMKLPKARPAVRAAAPTWEEQACIIRAAAGSWYETFYMVARYTGLRSTQILHLRWEHVDLDQAAMEIPPDLPGSKSEHEQKGRWVPLSPHLVAWLRPLQPADRQAWLIDRTVGVRRDRAKGDTRCLNSATVKRIWDSARLREDLRAQPTHCFRKAFRTNLLVQDTTAGDLISYLQGRSLGLDGDTYTVWRRLEAPLRRLVALIPPLETE